MDVFRREAVEEVVSPAPDHLAANHHVTDRVEQEIAGSIMTATKRVRRLPVRVRDVQH